MPRKCCWLKKLALDKQPQVQQQMQIHAYWQGVRHIACSACRTKTLLRYRIHICMVSVLGHFIFWLICDPCFLRLFFWLSSRVLGWSDFLFVSIATFCYLKWKKLKPLACSLDVPTAKFPKKVSKTTWVKENTVSSFRFYFLLLDSL